jgi:hypothetical protein
MKKFNIKHLFLTVLALFQGSVSLQARWFWYEPAPARVIIVEQHQSTKADAVVGLGACLGLGIAGIVKHCQKKKKFRDYVETFRDMGYSRERAKVYAQMAMNNPQGLEAVLKSIDQENAMKSEQIAEQKIEENKQLAQEKMQDVQHQQKMEQMSHEHKLNLLTYLVMFLSGFIVFGLGFLLFKRK